MCGKDCSKTSCPFAYTEESEKIQNYGCLPASIDIVAMRVFHGKTWACHSNPEKPCVGGLRGLREWGFNNKILDKNLVTEENVTKELMDYTQEQMQFLIEHKRQTWVMENMPDSNAAKKIEKHGFIIPPTKIFD